MRQVWLGMKTRVETRLAIRDDFPMLQDSAPKINITTERGVATLWLAFPGDPVNALDTARLRQLDSALSTLQTDPFIDRVVVRSAKPAGFCAGLSPKALASLTHPNDRAAFSNFGQGVFARLAALRAVTIAFIEGPCLGAGLELALACDYRLCVAGLTNHLGFPFERPCFGGSSRVPQRLIDSRRTLSGREARSIGLVDRAFCERRARLELQMFLDTAPKKRRRSEPQGLAEERSRFAQDMGRMPAPLPEVEPEIALARGFITPLEFSQLPKPKPMTEREPERIRRAA